MTRNRGMMAMRDDFMQDPIPEELRGMAKKLGVPPQGTMGMFLDHMRVHTHFAQPDEIQTFLSHFSGWDVSLEQESTIGQGDRIGTVKVAGKVTPIFAHMGLTELHDRTDPPLEMLFTQIAKRRKSAIVLHVIPRFFIDADPAGAIRHVLFQGGWHLAGDVWAPFLLTQGGPDDIPRQGAILKPGAPSRGLLRERGQDVELLNAAEDFHLTLIKRIHLGQEFDRADTASVQLATAPSGWSFFNSEEAFAIQESLMGSLDVPQPKPQNIASDDADLAAAIAGAPSGIVQLVHHTAPDDAAAENVLEHLAVLTNGFEGLDDAICENLTSAELAGLIDCSTAAFSADEMAYWLHEGMGWAFDEINLGEDGRSLIGHGDIFALLRIKGREEPVPVMFHGGKIDPTAAAEDFAFLTTRCGAQARTGGKPVIVMPATINMRAAPGDTPIAKGGGEKDIVAMAGYAFDGNTWFAISFGQRGSDPFQNKLSETDLLPLSPSGYTGPVTLPTDDADARVERPAPTLVYLIQEALDRHHNLGPDVARPRSFDPVADYAFWPWDEDWICFLDKGQQAAFEHKDASNRLH